MRSKWLPLYDCDGCGACCIHMDVEVGDWDIQEEPLVGVISQRIALHLADDEKRKYIALGETQQIPCTFLTNDARCSIHETKPFVCKRFHAGSSGCQHSRGRAGVGQLEPKNWLNTETGEFWWK